MIVRDGWSSNLQVRSGILLKISIKLANST
jgi:hypothetical protein